MRRPDPPAAPAAERRDPPRMDAAETSASPEDERSTNRSRVKVADSALRQAARNNRKALRSEVRRFTRRSRRRRLIWVVSVGAIGAVALISFVVPRSPLFAVEHISVVGTQALDAGSIQAALSDQMGRPVGLVDDGSVRAALSAFPAVESYSVEALPPHDLVVRIIERTPVGVLATGSRYSLVDAAGVVLSVSDSIPAGQPLLDIPTGPGSRAFQSAGLVVRALPAAVRGQLAKVTASTYDDVTLTLTSGVTVLWGDADQSVQKAAVLDRGLQAAPGMTVYDVSTPQVLAVR